MKNREGKFKASIIWKGKEAAQALTSRFCSCPEILEYKNAKI